MRDLLIELWCHKLLVVLLGTLGLGAGAAVAFFTVPVYRSTIVLSVASETEGAAPGILSSGIGQLAALAGVSMNGATEKGEYLAYLKGRAFTMRFIEARDLAPKLFPDEWDAGAGKWRTPAGSHPTLEDAYVEFDRNVRVIKEDKITGLVSVSIDAPDPILAADWANELVTMVNSELRDRARAEARLSLEFLQRELEKSRLMELRESIFRLIESQTTRIMLANVRQDYAFRIVDPALPSDKKRFVRPRRILTIALGGVLGGLVAAAAVGVWASVRSLRQS